MKKRAQPPDAHTYTILLRGLAKFYNYHESLPRALKIYHSMFADNCPVKPNIIHTNAVLKVCALSRDMDALWGVAAKLPARGPGAPNNLTFTTILNAIRTVAWQADEDLPDEEREDKIRRRQRAVMQGRKIWEEIISRWRAGDIWIDEELACAMGRLLLLGSTERDFDDVLSLAEQVMAVPRQKRRLLAADKDSIGDEPGSAYSEAESAETDESSPNTETLLESSQNGFSTSIQENKDFENQPSASPSTELMTVFHPKPRHSPVSVARPGCNTLSLLLDACINLHAIPSGQSYWGLLTDPTGPYNIAPDSENYHMYLRLLRVQRASKTAVELVEDMATGNLKDKGLIQHKTFRIAMSCCNRDKYNPNVMEHANTLLDIMACTLPRPEIRTLAIYIDLAGSVPPQDFPVLLGALEKIEPAIKQLKNLVNYSYVDIPWKMKNDILSLAQLLIGAYDKTFARAGDQLSAKERQRMNYNKGWLNEWVRRRVHAAVDGPKAKEAEKRGDVSFEDKRVLAGKEEYIDGVKGERRRVQGAMVDGLEKTRRRTEGGRRKRMERAARVAEESGEYDF